MRIAVVGAGHVGLVSAVCLAAVGHQLCVVDIDAARVERLRDGDAPFLEPGLDELLAGGLKHHRLSFSTEASETLSEAEVIFICVDTPNRGDGGVDLTRVEAAARSIARLAPEGCVLVNRSTAPVGTAEYVRSITLEERGSAAPVAVNPEFLAEGTAVRNFLAPDRIVIGGWDRGVIDTVARVYAPIVERRLPVELHGYVSRPATTEPVPVVRSDPPTAELVKYGANAFLAVKISFINELASIAEELGGDITGIAEGIGLDSRIGPQFLRAGVGWGGSCFPKDIVALQGMAETRGLAARILRAAHEVNQEQRQWVVRKLQRYLRTLVGRRVALLGLSFKADTDDLRNTPSLEIATELTRLGARVRGYDPSLSTIPDEANGCIDLVDDPIKLAAGAEALVLLTEWPAFADLDLDVIAAVMREPLLLDGRNFFDPDVARAAGFTYVAVGRAEGMPQPEQSERSRPAEQIGLRRGTG